MTFIDTIQTLIIKKKHRKKLDFEGNLHLLIHEKIRLQNQTLDLLAVKPRTVEVQTSLIYTRKALRKIELQIISLHDGTIAEKLKALE